MKRQAMMASLLALALLVSPFGNPGGLLQVNAQERPGEELYSVSGNAPEEVQPRTLTDLSLEETIQLDVPTNLRWGVSTSGFPNGRYSAEWSGVNDSMGEGFFSYARHSQYGFELSRDGQIVFRDVAYEYAYEVDGYSETDILLAEHSYYPMYYLALRDNGYRGEDAAISESGSYRFRVRALSIDGNHQSSEWSEWSDSIEYVRPERELGAVKPYWDEQQAGLIHFARPENAEYMEAFVMTLYKVDDGITDYDVMQVFDHDKDKAVIDVDFSDSISRSGEGRYYVELRTISSNVDVVANGRVSQSEILDTAVNTERLGGILDSAADKSAAETVELLTSGVTPFSIQQAMQTSDSFRERIKDLESRYAAERNIEVKAPAVSDAARAYVDPEKVSLVGAAFNAAQGQDVGLQMDVTPKEKQIPTLPGYEKKVQLDISLVSGGVEVHDLTMPISVTMPVPQGIDPSQMIILHYHADGTAKMAAFHVNGDRTITFTVTGFSTFVFAEYSGTNTSAPGQNANRGGSARSDAQADLVGRIAAAAPGDAVKVAREQNISALSNSVMQMLVKRGDVTLEMEYAYGGTDYHVVIPAGMAVDDETAWYGPLYLSAYYSTVSEPVLTAGADVYIVQRGDTLSRISRTNGMKLSELTAKNPQIKNPNKIVPGQVIYIN